jgi:hypothetical protein
VAKMINYEFVLQYQLDNLSFDPSIGRLSSKVNRAIDEIMINRRAIENGGIASCSVSYPFDKWFNLYRSIGYTIKHVKKLNILGTSDVMWRGHMSKDLEEKYRQLDGVKLDEHDEWHQQEYFNKITGFSIDYLIKAKAVFDKKCLDINEGL